MTENTVKTRVMLLFGGRSGEHMISCATASAVMAAIDRERFEVVPVGITLEGQWVPALDDPQHYALKDGEGAFVEAQGTQVAFLAGTNRLVEFSASNPEVFKDLGEVDVVFPLLHGPFGEDGTIQGLLDTADVRYVGCGLTASAAGMDKHLTKTIIQQAGIPVGRWELITDRQWLQDREGCLERIKALGEVVFVKPNRAGSSVGITRVADFTQLEAAVEEARRHDPRVIVEAATPGRELECGVLEFLDGPRASAVGEITVSGADFYDFETKYQDPDAVSLSIPADIPEGVRMRLQEAAVKVFDALGCEGLSRVDFFYNEETDELSLNEINTMPGFTPFSMYPTMWQQQGLSYPELVTHLIDMALTRRVGLR
ncbi:D-ala D-ala ligase N-terminal domain protein [Gleimia coleocanis DSM 15436]|uniref:D-alanine--D-alanine ligase n=1 Tax=Gleimia coleocanis DSM 15436 TaxID=525245 RepID=C0W162_9ACTO|nr:D-alanine--D-alanine ligase family protein [Gleimia coleocanis]EEH63551.1 D-ala D-ala ligase N-terminal domain protein [Gleimia coleocanis DSM 15436]